jgi:uncharacterized protein (DUF849 family)
VLKACLNGGVSRAEHPAVPITAAELAADAFEVRAAGADAVHVHPRDHHGRESLDPAVIADAVQAIREACPGLPVGVSTGAWIDDNRIARIERWTTVPDFASVNAHEDGALETARVLRDHGVQVEAGIWTPAAAHIYATTWDTPVLRILVEIMDDGHELELIMSRIEGEILLHAEGPAVWPILREATKRRLSTRIGLEDTKLLPDASPAPDNATLVEAAVAIRENETHEAGQVGLDGSEDLMRSDHESLTERPLAT